MCDRECPNLNKAQTSIVHSASRHPDHPSSTVQHIRDSVANRSLLVIAIPSSHHRAFINSLSLDTLALLAQTVRLIRSLAHLLFSKDLLSPPPAPSSPRLHWLTNPSPIPCLRAQSLPRTYSLGNNRKHHKAGAARIQDSANKSSSRDSGCLWSKVHNFRIEFGQELSVKHHYCTIAIYSKSRRDGLDRGLAAKQSF